MGKDGYLGYGMRRNANNVTGPAKSGATILNVKTGEFGLMTDVTTSIPRR